MNVGPCAKTITICTIISKCGRSFTGTNFCVNSQETCPREDGENYDKCKSICGQVGHAEEVAVLMAGNLAKGGAAYLEGHSYYCMNCQHILFGAGIESLHIVK